MKNIWTALNQNDLLQIYIECWIMLVFPASGLGFDLFAVYVSLQPDKTNMRVWFSLQPAVVISHLRQAMNALKIYC